MSLTTGTVWHTTRRSGVFMSIRPSWVGLGALISLGIFHFPSSMQGAPAVLDLAAAVRQGLDNSPLIREAEEKLSQHRHEKNQKRSILFPNISLSASGVHRKDSVADKIVSTIPFGGEPYNLYTAGLHGEQTLFAYGMFSGVGQAEIEREISAKDLETANRDLTRQVVTAFYQTVMNENLVRLLEEQEKGVREILGIAQRRLGLGGKKIDVLQVQTRLALLRPQIEKARNELATSTAALANLIGRMDALELRIRGELPSLSIRQIEKRLDLKRFEIPELEKIRLQRQLVEEQKTAAWGANLPHLKIVGDYGFSNFTKEELFDDASKAWSVQLVLDVPLFSGFSSFSERRTFVARDAQLEAQERHLANTTQLEQVRSRKELESAEASLAFAEEGARLAKESLREALREYRVGLIDFLQYFQIESAKFEAETSLLQLRYGMVQATISYFISSGQSLPALVELMSTSTPSGGKSS